VVRVFDGFLCFLLNEPFSDAEYLSRGTLGDVLRYQGGPTSRRRSYDYPHPIHGDPMKTRYTFTYRNLNMDTCTVVTI